ncbi:PREDICTED: uncharacterized protein LOC109584879 isoform X2 [Amphimedon queenslandica]|uniref:MARVEL domain-containing protein n=1 Tax=Amphimedon queenslandica TaxID=400682 RepID=A0AAN0JHR2_AMPQE|nr:PREDICTED: uncharacterized protein LOC109584879 isoform X2 [Amphimedon queenslandica]|eukprot:XP_019856336.1 PREDICTED: uncharacterized protein LOC109584879 isoform X2 [Amphimedon queenslandica]
MPSTENKNQVLSLVTFVILLVSLGAAGTSLNLIQANTNNGASCSFFITESQLEDQSLVNYNVPTCKLSIASATIATICLALLTAIELISVLFKINAKTLIAKILQIGFFSGSILFLFITTVVVSAGWGKTCATNKNITKTGADTYFDCTGPQYLSGLGPLAPNGAEIITAAAFAGIGVLLTIVALVLFIVKQMKSKTNYGNLTPNN